MHTVNQKTCRIYQCLGRVFTRILFYMVLPALPQAVLGQLHRLCMYHSFHCRALPRLLHQITTDTKETAGSRHDQDRCCDTRNDQYLLSFL